jgi:uncharacterized membrane protein
MSKKLVIGLVVISFLGSAMAGTLTKTVRNAQTKVKSATGTANALIASGKQTLSQKQEKMTSANLKIKEKTKKNKKEAKEKLASANAVVTKNVEELANKTVSKSAEAKEKMNKSKEKFNDLKEQAKSIKFDL